MQTIPRDIHAGMRVFDIDRNEIGKVEDFRFSENEQAPDVQPAELDRTDVEDDNSLMADVARTLAPDDLPQTIRDRMLTEGYVRLDTKGLFAADRYIFPEQIDSATGDELTLAVRKDDLMKRH